MATKQIQGYQVEIKKRGRVEVIDLFVGTVRGLRGRRQLKGEAETSDPFTPIIQFEVKHAKTRDDLFDLFIKQLIHRGYVPLRYRDARDDGFVEDWLQIDYKRYNLEELEYLNQVETTEG